MVLFRAYFLFLDIKFYKIWIRKMEDQFLELSPILIIFGILERKTEYSIYVWKRT